MAYQWNTFSINKKTILLFPDRSIDATYAIWCLLLITGDLRGGKSTIIIESTYLNRLETHLSSVVFIVILGMGQETNELVVVVFLTFCNFKVDIWLYKGWVVLS